MGRAYTPGLKVTLRTTIRIRRILPVPGQVLIQTGDRVSSQQIVAEAAIPGDITPINLAHLLSINPEDVSGTLRKQVGDSLAIGELVAQTKGLFGFFKGEWKSSIEGKIESISSVTGQMFVRGPSFPVRVSAYVDGTVTKIFPNEGVEIEAVVSMVQGIFGIGGETFGPIQMAVPDVTAVLDESRINSQQKGAVVVGGSLVTLGALRKAVQVGVKGIVCGGIDDEDIKEFLGYDLGVAITGAEKVGLTLVVTEGFGKISMAKRTFELLKSHQGKQASISGATQIRAGVVRPEILVPMPVEAVMQNNRSNQSEKPEGELVLGASLRIIRDPLFGELGEVVSLPYDPATLESGSKTRVVGVKLGDGRQVVVPRANVELIEG